MTEAHKCTTMHTYLPDTDFNLIVFLMNLGQNEETVSKREDGHPIGYNWPHAIGGQAFRTCTDNEVMEESRREEVVKIKYQNLI